LTPHTLAMGGEQEHIPDLIRPLLIGYGRSKKGLCKATAPAGNMAEIKPRRGQSPNTVFPSPKCPSRAFCNYLHAKCWFFAVTKL